MRDGNELHQQAHRESESADDIEVSVIVPVLNGAATIGDQLAALIEQRTARRFEVLICDNGSTDETRAVVADWQSRYSVSLRILDASDRRGPAHARNVGISQAAGRILLFCDADDLVDQAWLDTLSSAVGPGHMVGGWGEWAQLNDPQCYQGDGWSRELILRSGYLPGIESANVGMTTNDALELGGFDESFRYVEDVDFGWRFQQVGKTVGIAAAVVHYRARTDTRGVFRQQRRWGRYNIMLRQRHRQHVDQIMSFRFSTLELFKRTWILPLEMLRAGRSERRRVLSEYGMTLGEFEGHLWFRFLRRMPGPQLISRGGG